jgi:Fe-Mn family superoxide dismutase
MRTMEIHHSKHHAAYVNNLNTALEAHAALKDKPVEKLIADLNAVPEAIRMAVRNNGGGHANHTLFWSIMGPGGGEPTGSPRNRKPSAIAGFKRSHCRLSRFGSGWAGCRRQLEASKCSNGQPGSPVSRRPSPC